MLLIFLFIISINAKFTMFLDLGAKPIPNFKNWKQIQLKENHMNRQPIQPPWEWTNLTFQLPYKTYGIQFTMFDPNNKTNSNNGGYSADIQWVSFDNEWGIIYPSLVWWGRPWKLYVGFGP
jgi:hypothetical protein